MALADEIQELGSRILAALDESHDYYTYTKRVWRRLQTEVKEGHRFRFRNQATGTSVDESDLLGRAQGYVTDYVAIFAFQHFVSLFEHFIFDLLRLWLAAYPGSLAKKQVDLGAVLAAANTKEIVLTVADKELNEVKYGRVADWFAYVEKVVHLDCPTSDEIDRLSEIKATRDILVHNKGVVNATYLSKAAGRARFKEGDLISISEQYHRESWNTIKKVVRVVANAAPQRGHARKAAD